MSLSHAENKHWSKACAAVLRYETPAPHERRFQDLLAALHSSHRFGVPTATVIYQVVHNSHRFQLRAVTEDNGWVQWFVRAV